MIEGDGIGREVVSEGIRVLEAAGRRFDLSFSWERFDWSCERYAQDRPHDAAKMVSTNCVPLTPSTWAQWVIPECPTIFRSGVC